MPKTTRTTLLAMLVLALTLVVSGQGVVEAQAPPDPGEGCLQQFSCDPVHPSNGSEFVTANGFVWEEDCLVQWDCVYVGGVVRWVVH